MSAVWYKPIPTNYSVIDINDLPANTVYTLPPFSILKGPGVFTGQVIMSPHSWVIDCEITAPNMIGGSLIQANADDCNIINNHIHHSHDATNGILSGGGASGGLIYGNDIHDCRHVLYIQNFDLALPKYVVHNYIHDVIPGGNAYNIHAYTETANNMRGLRFYENVVASGPTILGGAGGATPPRYNQYIGNYFYRSEFDQFYLPSSPLMKHNNFYRSILALDLMWGDGEEKYTPSEVPVVKYNKFYDPEGGFGPHVITCRFLANGDREHDGQPKLHPLAKFDNNQYFGQFRALERNGVFHADITRIADWRNYAQAAGNRFDVHGTVSPNHPKNHTVQFSNAYDPTRRLSVTENWGGTPEFIAEQQ